MNMDNMEAYCTNHWDKDNNCSICSGCYGAQLTNLADDLEYMEENPGIEIYRGGINCCFELNGVDEPETEHDVPEPDWDAMFAAACAELAAINAELETETCE